MAQFALYHIKFGIVKVVEDLIPDLFADDAERVDAGYNYEHRKEILTKLLSQDYGLKFVIHQKLKDVTYNHLPIFNPHNPNVYILRFANNKETHLEMKFKDEKYTYNPSCLVVIDNREGVQRIAIQYSQSSFNSTKMVAKILERVLNDHLQKFRLNVTIEPEQYSNQFWSITKRHPEEIEYMNLSPGRNTEEVQTVTNLVTALDSTSKRWNGKPQLSYTADKGECLHLYESDEELRNLVDGYAKNNLPIKLRTRDGKRYTCFVKNAPEEMTVMETLNIPAKRLAELENKDLFNLEILEIIEFMTRIKIKYDL